MSAPLLLSAGDSTPGRLQVVEINLTTPLNINAPNWQPIQYLESVDFNPDDPGMVDATVFGDGGATGQDKLSYTWSCACVLNHMIVPGTNPPNYDPTHNYLETHAINSLGAANRVQLRMYDFDVNDISGVITPRGLAYTGFANYGWPRYGSVGQGDARKVSVNFMGKGRLTPISHPYPLTATVPVVTSVELNPFAVAGGDPIDIFGSGFTLATTVTIGGTAATKIKVIRDSKIQAITPAKAAGSYAVVVTNPTGPSTTGGTPVTYA